jgi:WS/DGAT/MGAT family acyltransferase
MQKLSLLDATFLYAETDNTPMHVAGLQHFELPPGQDADAFYESLKHFVEARAHLVPFMMRRLRPSPLGMDHPVWVLDTTFDIDYHVQRITLPAPGTTEQLEEAAAELHARPLDRARPLWRWWLIDGLESGHVAWYTQYHHACLDGMGGQAIFEIFFGPTPEPPPVPVGPEELDEDDPGTWGMLRDTALRFGANPVRFARMLPDLARTTQDLATRAFRSVGGMGAVMPRVPRTRFSVAIGPERALALGSIPLTPLKAIGREHGCTVNDAFMAVCAGGLRSYLEQLGELPERSLVAGTPVSVRKPGDTSLHNQVSMLMCDLATDREDPVERMKAIRESIDGGIGVVRQLDNVHLGDLTVLGLPIAFQGVATLANRLRLGSIIRLPMNLVISNIPGPRQTLYLNGARLLTHYPVSIPSHGNALNITVQSYGERMDFGLVACRRTVPDVHTLRDHILQAWDELQRAAGREPAPPLPVEPTGRAAPGARQTVA